MRRALEDDMLRVILITMLAIGTMTALPSFSAQAQYAVCLPVRGCLPTTQASYNACFQLALHVDGPGQTTSRKSADAASTGSSTNASPAKYQGPSTEQTDARV